MISTCLGAKKPQLFDDFDTDFDSGSHTSDDNDVRKFGFVVDQHIIDAFDDKTSGDECSVTGDNSAGIYAGLILILVIVLLMLIRTQGQI